MEKQNLVLLERLYVADTLKDINAAFAWKQKVKNAIERTGMVLMQNIDRAGDRERGSFCWTV